MRQRKLIFALMVLLPIFAGCKSESPTAPAPTTGGAPTGGVTPPVGATITLTVSNATPVINSTSTITANVTVSNSAVPDGTAVEFSTNLGTFTDTGKNTTVKITSGGNASAILTSGTAGTATVIVTVNNSSKTTTITFGGSGNPTPGGAPTITSVTPNFGLPTGGQQVTINGTNFRAPVRVLFDPGSGGTPKEAFVVSVNSTQIVVVTPAFDVGSAQTLPVAVTVITQAGTSSEASVTSPAAFTYELAVLTPSIRTVQPTSGPISGGTRVTIIGDAFQAPVQVFFGAAEAQVISVNFSQIVVMSPRASDTAPGGSGPVTGPVNIRVLNVNSGKDATLSLFRYIPKMVITTFGPTEGPTTGGTRVTIDGAGFDDPLAVGIAGVAAQVIRVSGTEIIAITAPVLVTGCANVPGPITVENTDNGDSATTGSTGFIYRIAKPAILSVTPTTLGGTTTIVVLNAQGVARIIIGGIQATIISQMVNPDGTTTFVVQIPASLKLDLLACAAVSGASAPQPTAFDVTYTSATTGCTDTAVKSLIVSPPAGPVLFLIPGGFTPFQGTITPATIGPPPTPATVTVTPSSETVNIVNTGNGVATPLIVTSVTKDLTMPGCAKFSVASSAPVTLNQCETSPVIATYNATPAPAQDLCNVTITTNAGNRTLTLVGTTQ